ncbi:MAG: M23 family metallopeptidase, partial [Sphingobacteriales bacterium]
MKIFPAILLICLGCTPVLQAQQFRFSDGLYRIPYADGALVEVTTNVWNHSPAGCFDMHRATGSSLNIVAAASGWIRAIRDFNSESCGGSSCCNDKNNFIILEHANGEWSSYIHFRQNSITNLGHEVNDWVTVGTVLGQEGAVGCASGSHLHLEVSRPFNASSAFSTYDGVLRRDGELLNPVICSVPQGYLASGAAYVASSCNYNCPTSLTPSGGVTNQVLRADDSITATTIFTTNGTGMY